MQRHGRHPLPGPPRQLGRVRQAGDARRRPPGPCRRPRRSCATAALRLRPPVALPERALRLLAFLLLGSLSLAAPGPLAATDLLTVPGAAGDPVAPFQSAPTWQLAQAAPSASPSADNRLQEPTEEDAPAEASPAPSPATPPANGVRPANGVTTNGVTTNGPPVDTVALPSAEVIQQRMREVTEEVELSEEVRRPLLEAYQRTLDTLQQIAEQSERRSRLAAAAQAAPAELPRVRQETEMWAPPPPLELDDYLPLENLRSMHVEAAAQLSALQQELRDVEDVARERAVRRGQIPRLLSEARAELQRLEAEPPPAPSDLDPRLTQARIDERTVRTEQLRQRVRLLEQEQRTFEAEHELLPARAELLRRHVRSQEQIVRELADTVSNRREAQSEERLAAFREALRSANEDPAQSATLAEGEEWLRLVRGQARLEREVGGAQARHAELASTYADYETEIQASIAAGIGLRSGLGLKLQRKRDRLPSPSELWGRLAAIDERIERTHALHTRIEALLDERESHGFGPLLIERELSENGTLEQRELQLLREMLKDIDRYEDLLIDLKRAQDGVRVEADRIRTLIDRHILWIRSSQPYALSDLPLAWRSFQSLVYPENVRELGRAAVAEVVRRPHLAAAWVLTLALLIGGGPRLRRQIALLGIQAEKRNQTAMRPTFTVLGLTALSSLLLVVLLAFPGFRLSILPLSSDYVRAVGTALLTTGLVLLPLEVMRQLVRPGGAAIKHFGWKSETVLPLRSTLRWFIDLGGPLVFLWSLAENSGSATVASSLARPLFAALLVLLSLALWNVLHPHRGMMAEVIARRPGGWLDRLRFLWHPVASALPLTLAVLNLAGFTYSSRLMAERLYWTLWLEIALVVVGGLLGRWSLLNRRRLMLAQMRQRIADAARREETGVVDLRPSEEVDMSEINTQTLRLIHALLIVLTLAGLWWVWAPVFPAVQMLDQVPLPWDTIQADGQVVPVTLGSLLITIPIVVLTLVAVRNVPGLLEVVLLQNLPLDKAARYAITTLGTYLLLMIGMVLALQTLGLRWQNIQWLVAALGVGLGFGLQEIFGNFISGIILLFEQPLRVGDVVTVDGTSGVVSKIRIRATTITNWDRQELIIPNKDLITGRVINWTLSDSANRIVIEVGVAYGSDTTRACELLRDICQEHPAVLEDPEPVITFDHFGDSALKLTMRCFLNTLEGRLIVVHELHTAINERFAAEEIEIAFPQRDLHIRTLPKEWMALLEHRPSASADA